MIRPGTGNGHPSCSMPSTVMTGSAFQVPSTRSKWKIALDSAAPTNPDSESGSCSQRTSSGIRPSAPRSTLCSSRRSSRFQKWIVWP